MLDIAVAACRVIRIVKTYCTRNGYNVKRTAICIEKGNKEALVVIYFITYFFLQGI